jgi:hypothetical protein
MNTANAKYVGIFFFWIAPQICISTSYRPYDILSNPLRPILAPRLETEPPEKNAKKKGNKESKDHGPVKKEMRGSEGSGGRTL